MSNTIRLGIIGTGRITENSHLPAALGNPDAEVAALIDPVIERADTLAKSYGIAPLIADSLDKALAHVDALVIATPNDSHKPLAIECLAAGKPVLIEKPFTLTVEEADQINQAAEQSDGFVAVCHNTRFRENVALLKELLDAHYFGQVHRFVNRFGSPGGWSPLSAYNLNREATGGGVLMVTAPHFLDRMLHLWGYPDEMTYQDDSHGGPEANCRAHFTFHGDDYSPNEGLVIYSKSTAVPAGTVIETEAGLVLLGEVDASDVILRPHDRPELEQIIRRDASLQTFPHGVDSTRLQMADFIQACQGKKPPMIDGVEAVESVRLIQDMYACRTPLAEDWYQGEKA